MTFCVKACWFASRVYRCAFLLSAIWLFALVPVMAQTYLQSAGRPTFTTAVPIEKGFFNAANGNIHLEIPVGSFPQRGGSALNFALTYDSDMWTSSIYGWHPNNILGIGNGPWRLISSADPGKVNFKEVLGPRCSIDNLFEWATYEDFSWTAPDGTLHAFNITTQVYYANKCYSGGTDVPTGSSYASDATGYFMSVSGYDQAVVFGPDGTQVTGNVEDTNGNFYSQSNGNIVDTLGRTPLTTTTNGNTITYALLTPPGTTGGTYTVTTESISMNTAFGQSGVSECSSNCTVTVIQSIQLPDGTSYSFNYDSGTTGAHYGLLTSMTLPTGGTIYYTWGQPFTDALGNNYVWLQKRTTPDSATPWQYAPRVVTSCSSGQVNCQQTNTITKPNGDTLVYTFTLNGGAWQSTAQTYTGSSGLVSTVNQCWNFVSVNSNGQCSYSVTSANPSSGIQKSAESITMPIPTGNLTKTTEYAYDSYGNTTQISEWNFGSSPSNPADRTTCTAYASPGTHILNRPSSVTVVNNWSATPCNSIPNTAIVAQILYGYDVYTYNGGTLASVTATGHDPNYGTNVTARGNVTQVQNLVSASTGTYLNSTMNYDTTGQVTTSYDPAVQKTSYVYSCQNAYPTTITNALSQAATVGFDCNTGLVTSAQDANNQKTSFSYDNMFRPTTTSYPDGGQNTISYNYNGTIYAGSTATNKVNSSLNLVTANNTDSLGRVASSVTTSDPDGNTTITTAFDSDGRVQSVSAPYRGSPNGYEAYVYDGLDRVQQITHADGHVSSIYYGTSVGAQGGAASQLCASGTYGNGYPMLSFDEANNKLQSWVDGFGRTIEADEPTATSGSLTANTCYSYDLNNNLTGVLAAGGNQTRSFTYDGLSRLIKAINPETGGSATPTFYNYDSDGNCATPNSFPGDLVSQVDPLGIRTCMQYDGLHRLTLRTYSDGVTPSASFVYDVSSHWGIALSNTLGRLTEEYTDTTKPWSASLFGYDPMGRVVLNNQCTPASCGTSNSSVNYTYDLLGDMASYTNGAGVTITQAFGGAGRLTQITSSLSDSNHPATLLTNVRYNALGEPVSATLGNGAVETLGYSPRGWPLTATVTSQSTGTPGTGSVTVNGSEKSVNNYSSTSAGPNNAGYGADAGGGGVVWTSINGGSGSASYVFNSIGTRFTDYLNATSYGFALPSTTTSVNGIQVSITRSGSNNTASNVSDRGACLLRAGAQVGSCKSAGYWGSGGTATYGSSTDLWGASWSASDVNNSGFGVAFGASLHCISSTRCSVGYDVYASVSSMKVTVYYTYFTGTTYDSGTVSVTINGTAASASYGNGSTTSSIATQLASAITGLGIVTASASGNVVSITSTTNGSNTNYSLSTSALSGNGFNPPSFSASPSGSSLTGGTGAPGTLYSFSLGYGSGNSNVTSANDSVTGNWVFTYDYLNRLSTSNQNNNQNACSYGYDQLGNRTSQTATAGSCGGNLSLSYAGNNNRMDGYTYDVAGNLKGDGLHTYGYDAANRLISVDNGTTASYIYDAEGRRVQKTAGAQVEYLYDLNGNIVSELSSTGAWNRGEIFANGQHLATYSGGTTGPTYFDHADWLGTERDRSNMADTSCESITNLPFGDSQSASGTCADASPLHFTGQQWDSETTSLDYFGARHYSSQFGRFMSPDPTGIFLGNLNDPQSLNLYAYVRNNPVSLTDPSGLCFNPKNPYLAPYGPCRAALTVNTAFSTADLFGFDVDPFDLLNAAFAQTGSLDYAVANNCLDCLYPNWGLLGLLGGGSGPGGGIGGGTPTGRQPQTPGPLPNNGEKPSACELANIAAVNSVSNLNVSPNNVVGEPFVFNGGLNVNFSVPGASPSSLPPGRYPSSLLDRIFGIGSSLHVPGPGGADPSTYGIDPATGNFTFTTHIDTAYATWHTPIGALIHYFVDVRDKGAHRTQCGGAG